MMVVGGGGGRRTVAAIYALPQKSMTKLVSIGSGSLCSAIVRSWYPIAKNEDCKYY